jgi:hypothetical protein
VQLRRQKQQRENKQDVVAGLTQKLWILLSAAAINDKGQIVGCGVIKDDWHAYLLTPIAETGSPTPTEKPSASH